MKRSEMVEHIAHELLDIAESRAYSNESNQSYYTRQARGLLAMIEGFGMLPPEVEQDFYDRHNNSPAFMSKWEKEDENAMTDIQDPKSVIYRTWEKENG